MIVSTRYVQNGLDTRARETTDSMYVIGLHNDEDSGACLMKDGVILEAISEERLNRTKLYKGLPTKSLEYLFDKYNLSVESIDHFVYGWHGQQNNYGVYAEKLARRVAEAVRTDDRAGDIIAQRVKIEFSRDSETRCEFENWMREIGVADDKIIYLDHHSCHAWGAFALSPFNDAIVFTLDGRGDLKSSTVSVADENGVTEIDYLLSLDSLGFLYGQVTYFLGYKPHRHEGKVTGLAAHGDPDVSLPMFEKLVSWQGDRFVSHFGKYKPFYTNLSEELTADFAQFTREDLAAGLQKHCENLVTQYVRYWLDRIDRPDIRNICLAGGVCANVRINQCIAELDGIDNIFVFPHMGDGGLPLGSACFANYRLTGESHVTMDTVYLGPDYSDADIETALDAVADRIKYEKPEDRIGGTVTDLMNNKVVGFFDGRMEYGPRALGARSIMFHTKDASVNDWLNRRMNRTEFMPFAPVTPIEFADACYKNWRPDHVAARFMTRTYDCTPAFSDVHKAVVHVDGTARPQIVDRDKNGAYYQVVKAYCDRTGEHALINTSFNAHEEPIVCSPDDAIRSLINNVIDVLWIGPYRAIAKS